MYHDVGACTQNDLSLELIKVNDSSTPTVSIPIQHAVLWCTTSEYVPSVQPQNN